MTRTIDGPGDGLSSIAARLQDLMRQTPQSDGAKKALQKRISYYSTLLQRTAARRRVIEAREAFKNEGRIPLLDARDIPGHALAIHLAHPNNKSAADRYRKAVAGGYGNGVSAVIKYASELYSDTFPRPLGPQWAKTPGARVHNVRMH